MIIGLIYNGRLYLRKGTYWSVRKQLGVPDHVITPWKEGTNVLWARKFGIRVPEEEKK